MLGASLDVGCWMLELLRKAGDERTETIQSRALRFLVVLFYRPDRAGHAANPRHPSDDSHQHYREWLAGFFLAFRLDHPEKRFLRHQHHRRPADDRRHRFPCHRDDDFCHPHWRDHGDLSDGIRAEQFPHHPHHSRRRQQPRRRPVHRLRPFGLGFFINFIGKNLDVLLHNTNAVWGQPALIWASLTLAVMTVPVVIVATEESLKAIPPGLREASLALGATKLETILKIVLPQALPGIMTGGILAVSRAAGEVAPILFTGVAYYMASLPTHLSDQFMDLGYHVFVLSTQSPNIEQTRPILYATVLVLLVLTFALNIVAIVIRSNIRRKMRSLH